ncbi:MAG: hypothetical protein LBU85_09030 [Treponema sp.]|nr:hypothetical protein [Treponema sp.]
MNRSRRSAKRRPVYVNGIYCESIAAGAREASRALGENVPYCKIQRALNGKMELHGLDISEKPPEKSEVEKTPAETGGRREVLIRYPLGGSPLDIGIGHFWR